MNIYTIGFTKKSAEEFFNLLKENNVKKVIDIRLNNKSQLAGFAKGKDLKYFLRVICNIEYFHKLEYAPTEELLKDFRDKKINWEEYKERYIAILDGRKILDELKLESFRDSCLLCSEAKAENCHRKLLANYLKNSYKEINIINL
jgi:uncharacterized protein (DUF488 family)